MLFIHLVADENWAITMARFKQATTSIWFLLGGGLCVQAAWCSGTILGHRLGAVISNPERFGLDFSFVAVFTALVFSFWKGRQDLFPWLGRGRCRSCCGNSIAGQMVYRLRGVSGGALAAAFQPSQSLGPTDD